MGAEGGRVLFFGRFRLCVLNLFLLFLLFKFLRQDSIINIIENKRKPRVERKCKGYPKDIQKESGCP